MFISIFQLIGAYSVSKAAQIAMVKSLVVACSKKNIRVNAVAAGLIKTSFSKVVSMTDFTCRLNYIPKTCSKHRS